MDKQKIVFGPKSPSRPKSPRFTVLEFPKFLLVNILRYLVYFFIYDIMIYDGEFNEFYIW